MRWPAPVGSFHVNSLLGLELSIRCGDRRTRTGIKVGQSRDYIRIIVGADGRARNQAACSRLARRLLLDQSDATAVSDRR